MKNQNGEFQEKNQCFKLSLEKFNKQVEVLKNAADNQRKEQNSFIRRNKILPRILILFVIIVENVCIL